MPFLLYKTKNRAANNNGVSNNNGAGEARRRGLKRKSRQLKKEKQMIEKGSRQLTVRRKKKFDPTISKSSELH
jgi:hypothetical protein